MEEITCSADFAGCPLSAFIVISGPAKLVTMVAFIDFAVLRAAASFLAFTDLLAPGILLADEHVRAMTVVERFWLKPVPTEFEKQVFFAQHVGEPHRSRCHLTQETSYTSRKLLVILFSEFRLVVIPNGLKICLAADRQGGHRWHVDKDDAILIRLFEAFYKKHYTSKDPLYKAEISYMDRVHQQTLYSSTWVALFRTETAEPRLSRHFLARYFHLWLKMIV
jgi:hypothetical protein